LVALTFRPEICAASASTCWRRCRGQTCDAASLPAHFLAPQGGYFSRCRPQVPPWQVRKCGAGRASIRQCLIGDLGAVKPEILEPGYAWWRSIVWVRPILMNAVEFDTLACSGDMAAAPARNKLRALSIAKATCIAVGKVVVGTIGPWLAMVIGDGPAIWTQSHRPSNTRSRDFDHLVGIHVDAFQTPVCQNIQAGKFVRRADTDPILRCGLDRIARRIRRVFGPTSALA